MLLVLMYHRIKDAEIFQSYIKYISDNYPIVIPGDAVESGRLSICLTFDDAYYDFYYIAFPVLIRYKIKAVVGVPVKYIIDETSIDIETRLNVRYDEAMKDDNHITKAPFCTWQELKEMADSGLVKIASHSQNHLNLTMDGLNLIDEIVGSKKAIEQKLTKEVDTFIFPYGKVNKKVHSFASKHYKYLMRIGSAINKDWQNSNNMIYRINGEHLINKKQLSKLELFKYYLKYLSNTVRGK